MVRLSLTCVARGGGCGQLFLEWLTRFMLLGKQDLLKLLFRAFDNSRKGDMSRAGEPVLSLSSLFILLSRSLPLPLSRAVAVSFLVPFSISFFISRMCVYCGVFTPAGLFPLLTT
jgi:hypothetical protein